MIGSRGWITKVLLEVLSFTKVIFELDLEILKESRVHQIEKRWRTITQRRHSSYALEAWRKHPTLWQIQCAGPRRILHTRKYHFFPYLHKTGYSQGSQLIHCTQINLVTHQGHPSPCQDGRTGPALLVANDSIFLMTLHSPSLGIMAGLGKEKEGEKMKEFTLPHRKNYYVQ